MTWISLALLTMTQSSFTLVAVIRLNNALREPCYFSYRLFLHWNNCIKECVPLTIFYHLHFLRISKVWSMLHYGSIGRVQNKECYFIFTYNFAAFFLFLIKKLAFVFFIFFLNQSESRNGDKKLPVELYVNKRVSLVSRLFSSFDALNYLANWIICACLLQSEKKIKLVLLVVK